MVDMSRRSFLKWLTAIGGTAAATSLFGFDRFFGGTKKYFLPPEKGWCASTLEVELYPSYLTEFGVGFDTSLQRGVVKVNVYSGVPRITQQQITDCIASMKKSCCQPPAHPQVALFDPPQFVAVPLKRLGRTVEFEVPGGKLRRIPASHEGKLLLYPTYWPKNELAEELRGWGRASDEAWSALEREVEVPC